ncbi:MAG: glycosyltransferase family 9 protein [Thermoleophilia bacterium]|nr:glycosyltransferase family 9 protein [Thermoleophilia bacterium]
MGPEAAPVADALVPDVHRIAVLRPAAALGDLIVTLPALEALRAAYPDAEIVLLGAEWQRPLLARRRSPVDRLVVVPPVAGVTAPRAGEREDDGAVELFCASLRAERVDLALQLHGGGRYSNPFVRRLGARVAAGLAGEDADPLDRSVPYVPFQPEVLRFLEAAALVGADPVTLEPRLDVTEDDLAAADELLPPLGGAPLAVVHPGATDARRRWPPERFAAVADELARAGARVVLTGVDAERETAEAVVAAAATPLLSLVGRLSLTGLVGVLARAAVVVGNDTGPLHLAAAVGTPTVGIYWCGNFLSWGPLGRARHRPAISWVTECPVCGADCTGDAWPGRPAPPRCAHDPSFVVRVSIDEVAAAAVDLLAATEAGDRAA